MRRLTRVGPPADISQGVPKRSDTLIAARATRGVQPRRRGTGSFAVIARTTSPLDRSSHRAIESEPKARASHPHRLALLVVFACVGAFYFWTSTSSGDPIQLGPAQTDYYNLLTDGFASGHLYLPEQPAAALVALPNPYDPAQAANLPNIDVPHDLSLYHDHFYLAWGPTPVFTLIWPWRLLHVGQLPQNMTVLVYSLVGFLFTLLVLEALVASLTPRAGRVRVTGAAILLGAATVIPYLLRRPVVYEVAISCAYCFIAIGTYLVVTALAGRPRPTLRLVLSSLCVGLAAGSRSELLVLVLPLAAIAWVLSRRPGRSALAVWTALLLPVALCAVLLGIYNWARFGNPLQVGTLYQLEGYNPKTTPFFRIGYIWPSLYYYVVAPIRPLLAFPYFALAPPPAYPFGVPSTYAPEISGGLIFAAPLVLLVPAAPWLLRKEKRATRWTVLGLMACAVLLLLAICASVPGATERYAVDFTTPVLLAASLCWFCWEPNRQWHTRLLTAGGLAVVAYSTLVGIAISITGPNDELRTGNPASYLGLEKFTNFIPELAATITGHPAIVRVIDPIAPYPENLGDYGTAAIGQATFYVPDLPEEIDVVAPHGESVDLRFVVHRTSASVRSGAVHLELTDASGHSVRLRFHRRISVSVGLRAGLNRLELEASSAKALVPGGLPYVVKISNLALSR